MAFVTSSRRAIVILLLFVGLLSVGVRAVRTDDHTPPLAREHTYEPENQHVLRPVVPLQPPEETGNKEKVEPTTWTATNALQELHNALSTMQNQYFAIWLGKWTTAIDWTGAVMGTHVSAALHSLSDSFEYTLPGNFDKARKLDVEALMVENEINKYFSQSITYYFGEDHFAVRNQAFDDILWVVLGWLESIKFINSHSDTHYPPTMEELKHKSEWHGRQFIPGFAHRARVFYELSEKGWDWHLCGGGMTWNPRLIPYKNAITNQLFIAASIDMYMYFPGDKNCSPFMAANNPKLGDQEQCESTLSKPTYDPIYLANAIHGYNWLKNSGMTNKKGLYVDGFHIKDYYRNHSKTHCDERNEMVYTYNQGVILSGLRGLWEGTGNLTYLQDGHLLIRNVIRATGWKTKNLSPTTFSFTSTRQNDQHPLTRPSNLTTTWSGLGSHGILTELCDPHGTCSQNGHTFKGIFFHHLTLFCRLLPLSAIAPGKTYAASRETASLHRSSCKEYAAWVLHNGNAALATKDDKGRFGAWWGADDRKSSDSQDPWDDIYSDILPPGAVDYRNNPAAMYPSTTAFHGTSETETDGQTQYSAFTGHPVHGTRDLNDRGRGRTVETQGGGVAVTRAMWEFLRIHEDVV